MKDSNNAIEVENVKKFYKVYYDRGVTLKDRFLSRGRSRYEKREVLKGITFEIKKGEAIGLIGKNGCGKSTTLKLLTKIIYPNEGTIEMDGRVSSLLELGAGFHPDMSGRENIYMNAAVFGLTKKEIDRRVEEIIRFSELEDYINNPVRTYSSGMYMRLAFSVAINVDADILLIDEILAVGDISFQKKCFEKLKEIKRNGTTIVIVSHSLDQIEKICDRTILIEGGLIKDIGKPQEVHQRYLYDMEQIRLLRFQEEYYDAISGNELEQDIEASEVSIEEPRQVEAEAEMILSLKEAIQGFKQNFLAASRREKIKNVAPQNTISGVSYTEMYITNAQNEECVVFQTGDSGIVYLKYKAEKPGLTGNVCLMIYRDDGVYCYGTNYFIEAGELLRFDKEGIVKIVLQEIPLISGKYYFTISLHNENAQEYETVEWAASIQMLSAKCDQGVARIKSQWQRESWS